MMTTLLMMMTMKPSGLRTHETCNYEINVFTSGSNVLQVVKIQKKKNLKYLIWGKISVSYFSIVSKILGLVCGNLLFSLEYKNLCVLF